MLAQPRLEGPGVLTVHAPKEKATESREVAIAAK
jgi:hypothetical protein